MIYSLKYSDDMPANTGGYAKAWFIRIRPKYKDDFGILQHELIHVAYWWKYGIIGRLLYKFSKKWRLNEELDAYREQLKYALNQEYYRDMYAGFIADNYNLDITKSEVLKII
jgi:hypothetical protein